MSKSSYKELCYKVINISRKAGNLIMDHYHKVTVSDIRFKDKNDLVSFVDIESEKYIIGELIKLLPGSEFIAEESFHNEKINSNKFYWIIDPLDGTTNYLHGLPVFSTSIALWYKGEIKIGVVNDPVHKECFYTWENNISYLNDQQIIVSGNNNLSGSLVATGFPYKSFNKILPYMDILNYFIQNTRGVRRLGSAAIDLVYVACGRFDVFYEYNLSPWDVAAGSLIIKNAGGRVMDFNGGDNFIFGRSIIGTNSELTGKVLNVISPKFGKL